MNFSAVILAGGRSVRMGRDKAGLPLEGGTLLERQLELVRSLRPEELFLSVGERGDLAAPACRLVRDNYVGSGPLAGIESALAATISPLLLVLAVDLPQMQASTLQWMLEHCDAESGVVPRVNGSLEPLAAVYPRLAHSKLVDLMRAGRHAVREFAGECAAAGRVRWLEVPAERRLDFINCNSPQDWAGLAGPPPNAG